MPLLVVTGGSRGIGAATVALGASRGYDVAFTYASDEGAAERVSDEVRAAGRRVLAARCDVADEGALLAFFAAVDDAFGPPDAMVTNAGITGGIARVEDLTRETLERVLAVNVTGTVLAAREAVRRMSTRHGGRGGAIVTLSSVASRLGSPDYYVHYALSKGAIDTFTLGLAREVAADGIRVNAVSPGLVATDIHASTGDPERLDRLVETVPARRIGTPAEIAETILWLASPASSYVVGAIVEAGGGR